MYSQSLDRLVSSSMNVFDAEHRSRPDHDNNETVNQNAVATRIARDFRQFNPFAVPDGDKKREFSNRTDARLTRRIEQTERRERRNTSKSTPQQPRRARIRLARPTDGARRRPFTPPPPTPATAPRVVCSNCTRHTRARAPHT